jgi:DNA-binding FadR family transcriptional regulator
MTTELVDRIVRGEYESDPWIPTEAQLGAEFGVSRTVVRESIQLLAGKGLVRIERGKGTFVQERSEWRILDPIVLSARLRHDERKSVLSELMTLRRAIEPELAAIACEKMDDIALTRLQERMEDLLKYSNDPVRFLEADDAFHRCIADIAQVSLASEILKLLAEPIEMTRRITSSIPNAFDRTNQDHLAIFASLCARNVEGARQSVRDHIDWNYVRLDEIL